MDILKNKSVKSSNYFSRYNGLNFYQNTRDVLSKDKNTGSVAYKEQLELTKWLSEENDFSVYICKEGDTYDSIALNFYNNPTYYWIICDFNRILDAFKRPEVGNIIYIPSISSGLIYEEY